MPALGSINVPVRKAVIAGLVALTGTGQSLEGVEVRYAWKRGEQPREQIFTNRSRGDTPVAGMRAGTSSRDETARFEVVILVESVGEEQDVADLRALALGTVLEQFLAARKSNELGVDGLKWIRVESWTSTPLGGDNSSITELVYTVVYSARLT